MAKKSLRIGFLIQNPNWKLPSQGGDSIQLAHTLRGLQAAGHHVTLLTLRWGRQVLCAPGLQSEHFSELSFSRGRAFRLIESVARRLQRELNLPWLQLFDSLRFCDASRQNLAGFDVLHERNYMWGVGGALASRGLKIPYVLMVDADFLLEHDFMGVLHSRAERFIATQTALFNYRAAHVVICVSQPAKDHLIADYGVSADKICVLPNAADVHGLPAPDLVRAKRAELGLDERPVVIFVGGFWPWHGTDSLVESFHIVIQQVPEARLVFVGDGPARPAVEQQVAERGLAGRVIFTGRVDHEEIPLLLAAADVAVAPYPRMPITFWGSPMKLFEYMAAGKAIVASRVGQIGTLLEHGRTGMLVEPDDVQSMARVMIDLLGDPQLRMRLGEEARRLMLREYSWQKYIERLESVYRSVCD